MNWFPKAPDIDHDRIVAAIREAEARTSGEIRVLIARHRAPDPVAAASRHFARLGMDRSPLHNGVLLFVAPRSRRFAVIGDAAVHEKCGDAFWTELTAAMGARFKDGAFTEGLAHGVACAGRLLAEHFPRFADDAPPAPPDASEVD